METGEPTDVSVPPLSVGAPAAAPAAIASGVLPVPPGEAAAAEATQPMDMSVVPVLPSSPPAASPADAAATDQPAGTPAVQTRLAVEAEAVEAEVRACCAARGLVAADRHTHFWSPAPAGYI
jgi:hypothetical protein